MGYVYADIELSNPRDAVPHIVSYVGPVQIHFDNRTCFTGALLIGDTVLLGAVPMEDMDLVVHPGKQTVTVNPESPNIPSALVKAVCLTTLSVLR